MSPSNTKLSVLQEMLWSVEERMLLLVEKPSTRVQACQLLAKSKVG